MKGKNQFSMLKKWSLFFDSLHFALMQNEAKNQEAF